MTNPNSLNSILISKSIKLLFMSLLETKIFIRISVKLKLNSKQINIKLYKTKQEAYRIQHSVYQIVVRLLDCIIIIKIYRV